jgi:hypothetical protein
VSDIDTGVVDSLKALDPERPIREADVHLRSCYVAFVPIASLRIAEKRRPFTVLSCTPHRNCVPRRLSNAGRPSAGMASSLLAAGSLRMSAFSPG